MEMLFGPVLQQALGRGLTGAERGERFETIPPWGTGGGTGGAGPAELPVVEWGVTMGRERGKA